MILTDKDAKTLENNTKFKSVELNEKFINVEGKESRLSGLDGLGRPESPEDKKVTLFEAKKLNESHLKTIKDQRSTLK
jgi:hypothetical protein